MASAESNLPVRPEGLSPVEAGQRFLTLDVLRGIAVLGILTVNILFFAFPMEAVEQERLAGLPPADAVARLLVTFFSELKFITLFSLLFGMGLAVQSRRAQMTGRPFVGVYARRLCVLLLFGLLHATLLWYGDILTLYAVAGFVLLLCRNVRTSRLLIGAGILFIVPLLLSAAIQAIYGGDVLAGSWDAPAASSAATAPADVDAERFRAFFAREAEIYSRGTWPEMVEIRTASFLLISATVNLLFLLWRSLAMFLLGVVLVRLGFFDDREQNRGIYRRMIGLGLALAVPLQATSIYLHVADREHGWLAWASIAGLYVGSAGLSSAYAGAVGLACLDRAWAKRLAPLAAVGRMALTNYIGQSVLCGFIFYGYGLGRFGQLGYAHVLMVAVAIYGVQIIVSPWWLRRFRFGPLEWLWRSATYWKLQPMRRLSPIR